MIKKIGLISDTHSYWDNKFKKYFKYCDEIWHAGDIGHINIADKLNKIAPLRGVYGNVDDNTLRQEFAKELEIRHGNLKIYMTHIGGSPLSYNNYCKSKLSKLKPQIFICGHSHICKIIYDKKFKLLYINPGASGITGFHQVRTIIRFDLLTDNIKNLEVIELGLRM